MTKESTPNVVVTAAEEEDDRPRGTTLVSSEEELGFNDIDPDDPNYKYAEQYRVYATLLEQLPEGWSRNSNSNNNNTELTSARGSNSSTNSKAPFIHVSGEVSWKHPNQAKMKALFAREVSWKHDENHAAGGSEQASKKTRSDVKKLRLMLKRGLPLLAVENQARLYGVDMALVLQQQDDASSSGDDDDDDDDSNNNENCPPPPLISKYRRMLKSGVPLPAVQQLAYVDGGWSPEQIVKVCGDLLQPEEEKGKEKDVSDYRPAKQARTGKANLDKKYEQMAKSGVPLGAIQQMAARDGVEISAEQLLKVKEEKTSNNLSFTPTPNNNKGAVAFAPHTHLAALVRKMAQTVQQKRTHQTKDAATMNVDGTVLYNALGALQGVQLARDNYNSTTSCGGTGSSTTSSNPIHNDSWQEVRAKRQAFGEIARTVAMELPKDVTTPVDIEGLDDLVNYITETYKKELMDLKTQLQEEGTYDFDSLALLYRPGSKVVAKNAGGGGVDMICQVAWNRFEAGRTILGAPMKYFKVCFQYVVALDASHATFAEVVEGTEYFEGRRQVMSALTFVPVATYSVEEQERLLAFYRRRGETYNQVALRGKFAYMAYQKGCFFLKRGGGNFEKNGSPSAALATSGRIMVDTAGAYEHGHTLGVGYDPMVMGIKYKFKEYSLHVRSVKQDKKKSENKSASGKNNLADDKMILLDQVPADYLDMVWPCVVGFSLTAKAWGDVLVDGLEEIQFQDDVFDRLVLPESRKRMVKALVRHSSNSFHDLVEGKGEGTVFLMYGPPGCGKTLTAEAVAELLHKPLYSLSMGTLGTQAGELEERLGQIMNLSSKWDALILLDEADSFLESRSSSSSLERNAMISVMLKLVEYFSGILFLTSNRIDSLDPAFQTRITLALRYEPLDKKGRSQVWKNLMIKSGFEKILEDGTIDPVKLAKSKLNGREIKNALRLAMAMAADEGKPLSQNVLMETVNIVNDYKQTMAQPYDYGGSKNGLVGRLKWW